MRTPVTTYFILGSNLGDRMAYLEFAFAGLSEMAGMISKASRVYETEPWGVEGQENYLNRVLQIESMQTATELLKIIRILEELAGRDRKAERYASRTLDIDILYYGSRVIQENELLVPHPEISKRRFVLEPLCEIAPEFVHPLSGKTNACMLSECDDNCRVLPFHDKKIAG
jgi:2-amino-4-hydroxy-6-hydroxymethyldihydropteridine diphosphokinase